MTRLDAAGVQVESANAFSNMEPAWVTEGANDYLIMMFPMTEMEDLKSGVKLGD